MDSGVGGSVFTVSLFRVFEVRGFGFGVFEFPGFEIRGSGFRGFEVRDFWYGVSGSGF